MVTTGFFRGDRFIPEKEIPNLEGQVYIVTGGTKGIGFGIVSQLLKYNAAKVIMLSSNKDAADKAVSDLRQYGDTSRVIWRKCNLTSLKEVDALAKNLRDEEPRIDSLVLNAGIGIAKFALSEDGIDNHFQINALSQLHLALILLPTLQKTSSFAGQPSRLIMMASEMHRFTPWSIKFESLQEVNTDIGSSFLYGRSKLAQILLIRELARRADEGQLGFDMSEGSSKRTVLINATHPGGVRTAQQQQVAVAYGWVVGFLMWLIQPLMVDPLTAGCASGLFASTPNAGLLKAGGLHGKYIVPDKQVARPSGQARDDEMAKRLWGLSLALLKDKLGSLDYDFEVVV